MSTQFLSGFRYVTSPHQAAIHLGSLVSPRIWWGADEAEAAVFGFWDVCVLCECIFQYLMLALIWGWWRACRKMTVKVGIRG